MSWRSKLLVSVAAGGAAAAGVGLAAYRVGARRLRVGPEQVDAAGLTMPDDVIHHHLAMSDGGTLHVVERGQGPALLLVHGVTLSAETWIPQLRRLADGHRVLAVDQRGHGESRAGQDGYAIDRMADDLDEVLEQLDVRRAVLAGHSMGGMVSLRLCSRHPEEVGKRVAGLVLVATSAGPVVRGPANARTADLLTWMSSHSLGRVQRLGKELLPDGDLGRWVARVTFGANPDAAQVELTRRMTNSMDPEALVGLLAMLLAFDVSRDIGTITLPTRVLVGTRDLLTPPRMARAMLRTIPGSTLTTYPGAGHMLMLERATEVNEVLHELSASVARGGRVGSRKAVEDLAEERNRG